MFLHFLMNWAYQKLGQFYLILSGNLNYYINIYVHYGPSMKSQGKTPRGLYNFYVVFLRKNPSKAVEIIWGSFQGVFRRDILDSPQCRLQILILQFSAFQKKTIGTYFEILWSSQNLSNLTGSKVLQ